jgi:hypothetical protein
LWSRNPVVMLNTEIAVERRRHAYLAFNHVRYHHNLINQWVWKFERQFCRLDIKRQHHWIWTL